jgi:adenosylmethionine-8-amino-7-oxononanoate aminotransferase
MPRKLEESQVFSRSLRDELPVAASAEGAWITDADGKRYLDAAGGAVVVSIGHGDREVARAISEQLTHVGYVHATQFTTESVEAYASELAEVLPLDDPRVYPVSGGSEAVETALKLARAYHLARGEPSRHRIIARWGSYHGNTRGALDASGREPLRAPYAPWLGQALHVPAVYEYRCPWPRHPESCGARHAEALERAIVEAGPSTVAAFIAEPVVGATLGAAVPPEDYWTSVADVCRRYGVLLIADEVMTGFGRTGAWFGVDHWGIRPDILVAGKGASSGYWPLGLCVASGEVFDAIREKGFTHGFTYSHHAVGAAAGRAVLRRLRAAGLLERARDQGELLLKELRSTLADDAAVGDVRGMGLMIGIELVADRESKRPFPRTERVTERVLAAGMDGGITLYPSVGSAGGTDGDVVMLGPPLTITDEERGLIVERTSAAIRVAARSVP